MSTRAYRKPLRGGGSRIIPRTPGGRFTRAYIDVDICPHCRGCNTLETINEGSETFPLREPMDKKETAP